MTSTEKDNRKHLDGWSVSLNSIHTADVEPEPPHSTFQPHFYTRSFVNRHINTNPILPLSLTLPLSLSTSFFVPSISGLQTECLEGEKGSLEYGDKIFFFFWSFIFLSDEAIWNVWFLSRAWDIILGWCSTWQWGLHSKTINQELVRFLCHRVIEYVFWGVTYSLWSLLYLLPFSSSPSSSTSSSFLCPSFPSYSSQSFKSIWIIQGQVIGCS